MMKINNLKTIRHYGEMQKNKDGSPAPVTTGFVYKKIKEKKLIPVIIDGVQFIDIEKYPDIRNL